MVPDALKFQNGSVPSASIACVNAGAGTGASLPVAGSVSCTGGILLVGIGCFGVGFVHHTSTIATQLIRKSVHFMSILKKNKKQLYAILSMRNCKDHLQLFLKRVWRRCFFICFKQ